MAGLIKQANKKAAATTLKKAGDATHDPADLGSKPGVRLLDIPIKEIDYNPLNVRDEDIETDPLTDELAESMTWLGQLQPATVVSRTTYITAYPDQAGKVTKPWVVMVGNRRRAGAFLKGWSTLECVVRDRVDTPEQLDDLPIHENLHRKGINPLRMAYYLADQKKKLGSERAVAEKVKKTQPWVNQMLKLLKLIPELQALVKSGELNAAQGRALAKLDEEQQRELLNQASELDTEERQTFWSEGARRDKSFINEGSAEEHADTASADDGEQAGSVDSAETQPANPLGDSGQAESKSDAPDAPQDATKPALIIRVMDRSPKSIAVALRANLTSDEVVELARELTASK